MPAVDNGPWDEIRGILKAAGFDIGTITLSGTPIQGLPDRLDFEDKAAKRSLGYDISGGESMTEFAERALGILQGAAEVYRDRNAVYKDNFRMVGQTMVALFPEGRPPLVTAEEYDRWHIFELIIVKLTRYANNYDQPHEDSLLDMLPYLAILGSLDQELRERFEEARRRENLNLDIQDRIDNLMSHPAAPQTRAEMRSRARDSFDEDDGYDDDFGL